LFSWNAEVRLKIKNGLATLQSESRGDNFISVNENKNLLQNFISKINGLKKSVACRQSVPERRKFTPNFSLN